MMLRLGVPAHGAVSEGWQIPVLTTVATRHEGIAAVVDAVEQHRAYLKASGRWAERERERVVRELHAILRNLAFDLVQTRVPPEQCREVVDQIQSRALDPYTGAEHLLADALGVAGPT